MYRSTLLAAALAVASIATPALAQNQAPGLQIGVLTCAVTGESNFIIGSSHALSCSYKPAIEAPVETYTGKITDYGLDIGSTANANLVWGVLAPSADMKPGALAGTYAGVTAGVTLGAGLEANALIGGLDRSIALNPLSLESNTGANITLGVAKLTLKAAQ
ncbi:DUF992 domain-containing protein [Pannonibacter sp.]|uniref:DUF992 domain-containing protein n=1 Tax=Pannonibacter sp. TaxID=1906786 RepID=UPI003F725957